MKLIIELIVCCQIFAAGMYFQDRFMWRDGLKDAIKIVVCTALIASLGIGIVAIIIPIWIGGFGYHKIINALHLPFLIKYVWLKRPLEYDDMKLKKAIIHKKATELKAKLKWYSFGDMVYIWLDKWIAKTYPDAL